MDERLNELLIQEINKSVESLNHDKTQLTDELQKYEGREEAPEKAEFESDLRNVNSELEEKKSDLEKVENINKSKAAIEKVEKDFEKDYQNLLKEKEECEAEIQKLEGKKVFENGVLAPTREQQEYEKDLAKISMSLKKFDDLKEQHKKDLEGYSKTIEGLLTKYNIREKYKSELENEPLDIEKIPPIEKEPVAGKTKVEEPKKEEKETLDIEKIPPIEKEPVESKDEKSEPIDIEKIPPIEKEPVNSTPIQTEPAKSEPVNQEPAKKEEFVNIYSNSQPIKVPVKDMNLPKNIENITCSIIKGKLVYTIVGVNEKGEQFAIDKEVKPIKMSGKDKRDISRNVDRFSVKNVDVQLYRILKYDKAFRDSNLANEYMEQIDRLTKGGEKDKTDMNIVYNLQNIREAKLSRSQKRQIKAIARRSDNFNLAEYIKPKSRLREILGKVKQNLLTAGEEKEIETMEKNSNQNAIDANSFREEMKNPVTYNQTNSYDNRASGEKINEHEEER